MNCSEKNKVGEGSEKLYYRWDIHAEINKYSFIKKKK